MKMHSCIFSCLFIFTAFLSSANLFAQNNKDTAKAKVKKDTLLFYKMNEDQFNYKHFMKGAVHVDTVSIDGFQKNDYLTADHPFTARFSNVGLAYRDLVFDSQYNFDFVSSRKYFDDYFLTNENACYYNVNRPLVDAYLAMGPKREQLFDVLFTRNFKKQLNLSVDYKLIHSLGTYLNQTSNDAFVILTGNYATKNKRYVVLGNYFYNRMKVDENGGVQNDTEYMYNYTVNKQLIAPNFTSGDSTQNRIKESGFYIKQYYFLGYRGRKVVDSTKTERPYFGFGRLSYSLLFKNQSYMYYDADPNSGFYPAPKRDSTHTLDSIHIKTFENTFEWSNIRYLSDCNCQHFILRIGVKQKFSKLFDNAYPKINKDSLSRNLSSLIPEASARLKIGSGFEVSANAFYILSGYNKGDYDASGMIATYHDVDSTKAGYVGVKGEVMRQSPAWFDRYYTGNSFSWNLSLNPTYTETARLFYHYRGLDVYAAVFNVKDIVYYDYSALPTQYNINAEVGQIGFKKNFRWRSWELANNIVCQKTQQIELIRMPELMSDNALSYNHYFFNKALMFQIGVEMTFFSSYTPLAWMPATREFYQQNVYKSANYPYLDAFLNIRIKRARLFLKLEHANWYFMGYNYIMIPNYPMADMALKFGVAWKFYD